MNELAAALTDLGWRCKFVGRRGLLLALFAAICGRGTVHLHWYEGFSPGAGLINGVVAWLYLPALWLAGQRGRVVWTVHNVVPHGGYPPLLGPAFLRLLARSCSCLLVHFEETRELVAERFAVPGKVFVTPPAAFGHAHGPPIDRSKARARICGSLTGDRILFVQIGTLHPYKQPAVTVTAFRDAAPSSALLLVAGPCDEEPTRVAIMQAAADDHRITVQFGLLPDEDLVAALCAADWSICPYLQIDNPGAVNLSVAYECPVIAPDFPVVRKVTVGHPTILYPVNGSARQALAEAIATACTEGRSRPITPRVNSLITRRDQARQTAEHYLSARIRPLPVSTR